MTQRHERRSFERYFDNAATSFPKPPEVAREISRYLNEIGGPYGRSSYGRAVEVSRAVEETRDLLASFTGCRDPEHVCFCANATTALNTVLKGMDLRGKEVLVSPLEHNAVMRPLEQLRKRHGLEFNILSARSDGRIDVDKIVHHLSQRTGLVIIAHQSNVNGVIQPVAEIKSAVGDIPVLVDAAQSLGSTPVRIDDWKIDFLAFTGHKSLLGPTGTGGLFIRDESRLDSLTAGGTGSKSEEFAMPHFLPDKFEAGTPNIAGIFGLRAALKNVPGEGHTRDDFLDFVRELKRIQKLHVFSSASEEHQGKVVSLTHQSMEIVAFAQKLNETYGLETRIGLHCAPLAHMNLGTFPVGTVRISPSRYHTPQDFEMVLGALATVAREG